MKKQFVLLFKKESQTTLFLIILFSLLLTGCFRNYYRIKEKTTTSKEVLQAMQAPEKYLVLHNNNLIWNITEVKIENGFLSGKTNRINSDRYNNLPIHPGDGYRYRKNNNTDQSYITNEIHIYVNEPIATSDSVKIALDSIKKIELFDKDKAATIGSYTISTIGVAAAVLVTVGVIVILSDPNFISGPKITPKPTANGQSSCPFVYTTDGEDYSFAGEIFGGALYPKLERDDYLALPALKPFENNYHIYLNNQAKEIQSINLAELYVIDHPSNSEVFMDKYGNTFTSSAIQKPLTALDSRGRSQLDKIAEVDNLTYYDVPSKEGEKLNDELFLTFAMPDNCLEGKLILRIRNSLIVDYSYQQYAFMFGKKWEEFQKRIHEKSSTELNQWVTDQEIPLSVSIEENGKWKILEQLLPTGPLAFRDYVVKLDLNGFKKSELRVKLASGELFWEIDRVGIDFSPNCVNHFAVVKPFRGVDQDSINVLNNIRYDDNNYLTQPRIGDETELVFTEPAQRKGEKRSVFLHSKGYYTLLGTEGKGKSMLFLHKFKKPASFTHFVNENYFKISRALQN